MASGRFSFIISVIAVLCALFLHILAAATIYYGSRLSDFFPKNSQNIVYAEIELIEEKTENLHWIESDKGAENSEEKEVQYSYIKNEPSNGNNIVSTDIFMTLYESEADFLLDKLKHEVKVLDYALDIAPEIKQYKKSKLSQKKTITSKRSSHHSSSKSQTIARGKKQSAYCRLDQATSSQKPKKPTFVKILVGKNGKVQKVLLTRSSGMRHFDNAALRIAHRAKCRAEIINGTLKAAYVNIRISPN